MHFASLLLLPLLVAADQAALTDKAAAWFEKAKEYIPGNVPNPVEAGAAKFAEHKVERINIRNWERKLSPKPDTEEEWLVYMTGGNKTCFGRCDAVDVVWNVSTPNAHTTTSSRSNSCAYRNPCHYSPHCLQKQDLPPCASVTSTATRNKFSVRVGGSLCRRSTTSLFPRSPTLKQKFLCTSSH